MTALFHRSARRLIRTLLTLLCALPGYVIATNGTNALALSPEAFGIGGADIGYIRDTAAVAVNPANLAQIRTARLDAGLGVTGAGGIRHRDAFGNSRHQENTPIPFSSFGYARRLSPDTVAGIALVGIGGVGVEYSSLNTAFGTRDRLKNILRIAKLSTGFSRQVNPSLSLGASLELLYSDLEQDFFPHTSAHDAQNPSADFFGYSIDQADTLSAGIRLGMRLRISEHTHIGLAYVTPMDLDFDDVRYTTDLAALGLGTVHYQADITHQQQPRELGIGIAFKPVEKLAMVAEVNWIDWSSAFDRPRLTATRPDNPQAPAVISAELIQEWHDQYVFSAGAVYQYNHRLTLRTGVNYARNPIPDQNLLPLFPLIGERHAMLGLGYDLPGNWLLDGVFVRSFPNTVSYTNPNAPFGPDAEEKFGLWHLMVTLSYRWKS